MKKINVECGREVDVWVFFKLRINASFKMNEVRCDCDGGHVGKNILLAGEVNTPLPQPPSHKQPILYTRWVPEAGTYRKKVLDTKMVR